MNAQILADVDLPRSQTGANPQHLVLGLFTDHWSATREPLPSAALVALLSDFGSTPVSARAAIGRLARRGVLEAEKRGRRTYYRMTQDTARVLEQTQLRMMEFGTPGRPWDGLWTTVIFSVPDEQRDLRHVIRRRLRFLGYAAVYDGVWMSPRADHGQTAELLRSVGVRSATVLRSTLTHTQGDGDPLAAWDLDAIGAAYAEFIARHRELAERTAAGQVGSAEALAARTKVKEEWLQMVSTDPELPADLLPDNWPGHAARALFAQVYDALGPLAEVRVRQVIAEHEPALADEANHRTTEPSGKF
ncbi:PaaX family transcriptional regulator [Streptomyces endophyticus]|uniref:Transcriptional regulator, PaaX family protein n=1 Tax=Streptomyces endophyticus TaxID=714166 RepID=A0ABU6EWS5_9ACTN|nr:PaaX family transcriptional regulator C-terminal domain-containing protein [Streptomyces endophyticus]MEB8336206.1 transcriptional regulator, PaaX family protein [Streptomyces endophyticus]